MKAGKARSLLGNLVKKGVLSKEGNARNTMYLAGTQFPEEKYDRPNARPIKENAEFTNPSQNIHTLLALTYCEC